MYSWTSTCIHSTVDLYPKQSKLPFTCADILGQFTEDRTIGSLYNNVVLKMSMETNAFDSLRPSPYSLFVDNSPPVVAFVRRKK